MSIARSSLTIVNTTFTGDTKFNLMTNIRSNLLSAGMTSIVGAAPTTATITIASPAVVTMGAGSAPVDGTRVVFSTSGALPTGLVVDTVYFVKSPSGSTFNVAATSGGAAINTSGSQSGTQKVVFEIVVETLTTPQSLKARFRFRDNGGQCVTASVESAGASSQAGSNDITNGVHFWPQTGKIWRIICSGYYWWLMVPYSYSVTREFGLGHVVWLPSTLVGSTYEAMFCSGQSFTDSTTFNSLTTWRQGAANLLTNGTGNWECIWNGQLNNNANTNTSNSQLSASGPTQYAPTSFGSAAGAVVRHYSDGSFIVNDPWLTWCTIYGDLDPRVRGMLWDAAFIQDSAPGGDTVATFDGNTWTAIGNGVQPTLWVISA